MKYDFQMGSDSTPGFCYLVSWFCGMESLVEAKIAQSTLSTLLGDLIESDPMTH